MGPDDLAGGPRRRPCGDAVIDHHRSPANEGRTRTIAPKTRGPPLELSSFRSLHRGHLVLADPRHGEHLVIQDPYPVFADRAHTEFRLIRHAELAHDDHV